MQLSLGGLLESCASFIAQGGMWPQLCSPVIVLSVLTFEHIFR